MPGPVGFGSCTAAWGEGLYLYLHCVHFCDLRVHCLFHRRDLHHVLVLEKTVAVAVRWGFVGWLEILGLLALLEIVTWGLEGLPGNFDMLAVFRHRVALG